MKGLSIEAIYKSNEDFKEYVDKYARDRGLLVIEALNHKIVKEMAEYYVERDHG